MKKKWKVVILVGILSMVGLAIGKVPDAWLWNWRALSILKGIDIASAQDGQECPEKWMRGMAAGQRGEFVKQRQALVWALACGPEYVSLVQAVAPQDAELAQVAAEKHPENAKAWYWLGEASAPLDYLVARRAYLKTVELDAYQGWAWCRLGRNYESTEEYEEAKAAFLNCCYNGDPGSNGCYGAGRMMEKLGNIPQAIEYYRLSRWEGALARADELEAGGKP